MKIESRQPEFSLIKNRAGLNHAMMPNDDGGIVEIAMFTSISIIN